MNIPLLRLLNQQLATPRFGSPAEVVAWMGAMQAQDFRAVRQAIGMRMKSPSAARVDRAFDEGLIVRTHVMRPTWHAVAAQDLRWMLMLSRESNGRAYRGYLKATGIEFSPAVCDRAFDTLTAALSGGRSLTAAQLQPWFAECGLPHTARHIHGYLWMAENSALVCSGRLHPSQNTYALTDERIAPQPLPSREEALARLAGNYFRSHAPATLDDFLWWSGLTVTEARQAIALIGSELTTETHQGITYHLHHSCRTQGQMPQAAILLPPFDEYLLGYKDRTAVLPRSLQAHAFTNNGIFFPMVVHRGQLVGNWRRPTARNVVPSFSFFRDTPFDEALRKGWSLIQK